MADTDGAIAPTEVAVDKPRPAAWWLGSFAVAGGLVVSALVHLALVGTILFVTPKLLPAPVNSMTVDIVSPDEIAEISKKAAEPPGPQQSTPPQPAPAGPATAAAAPAAAAIIRVRPLSDAARPAANRGARPRARRGGKARAIAWPAAPHGRRDHRRSFGISGQSDARGDRGVLGACAKLLDGAGRPRHDAEAGGGDSRRLAPRWPLHRGPGIARRAGVGAGTRAGESRDARAAAMPALQRVAARKIRRMASARSALLGR